MDDGGCKGAVWPVGKWGHQPIDPHQPSDPRRSNCDYKRSFNIAAIKELNSREAGIARFDKARLKTVGFQDEEL